MLMWVKPNGMAALATFRAQAAPLFETYGLRVDRQLKLAGKGQIVGENRFEVPHLAQVISFPSAAQFKAYVSDPLYLALAQERDKCLQRMTVMAGTALDVSNISTPGQGPLEDRMYGVGLVKFRPGGAGRLDTFNQRAQGLFARHGMHVESMLEVQQTLTPVGDVQAMQPERVVVFFLDNGSAMKAYATDPEYAALAPFRDSGLETYDFFLGAPVLS